MKGDRMPTILPPLAMEEYTDTWLDFLLDPVKLNDHIQELIAGKSNHPNVSSIIKTLLRQYEKYIAQQQQHQSEQTLSSTTTVNITSSPTATTTTQLSSSSGAISNSTTTTTSKRLKLIIDLVINVITNLKFSLDDFEKNIPIKHQRVILEQLESKSDVDVEYQTFLNRWVLRGIIKGTPIKYLLSNYSSSPTSPNLISSNILQSSNLLNTPMTPPSTPPPTPPSFISLQNTTAPSPSSNTTTTTTTSSDTNTSLEELFYKSNLFLNEWINENYDSDKPSEIDKVIPIVLFELGEFQFYKENFYDARKLFDKANEIINQNHILQVIEKSEIQYKQLSNNIKGIVGNKLQQLSNYKEKIQCLIIACKTIDLYDNENKMMDTSTTTTTVPEYENNKNFQIEKALSSKDVYKVISILTSDISDCNKSTSLDFNFRLNLEFNILPSMCTDKLMLLNVHFGNLLKSTIIQYQYNNYDLEEFKQYNKESIQLFFTLVKMVVNSNEDKVQFLLFKINNILSSDHNLETNYQIFIDCFKKSLSPSLLSKVVVNIDNIGSNDNNSSSNSNNSSDNLIFINFIKGNEPVKIQNSLELLKKQYKLSDQQCDLIYYQKALDLFEMGDLKSSSTILIDYLAGNSSSTSSNSVDFQLFLYDIISKNYKKQQAAVTTTATTKTKTSSIVTETFKSLVSKHGPPSEFIAERILSTLINRSKWETVKSISNILRTCNESSSTASASLCELVYIAEHLASIGKLLDIEIKEKKLAVAVSVTNNQDEIKNENNSGTDNHTNSDREDSDMDIDDDNLTTNTGSASSSVVPDKYSRASTPTPFSTLSSANKSTINSKSEEIYIGFISSILPRYEQKSIHWTFIKNNNFYSKNSNHVAGLLNLLEKKSLYNRIVFIFVGLIHSIQIYKKVQNDLNLDLYNEISTQISNTITFPNKHFSIEIETMLLNVYLDTLNRMNKIFGIKIDSQQKKQQQNDKNLQVFNNGRNLIYIGDIYFEKKFHRESLRYYLLGCALENAFYSDSLKTSTTNTKYLAYLSRRLFDCFYFLRAPMQAIVVSQLFGNLNQTCLVSFKIIQEEYYQLDSNYFQYIWEIPLLEILLNTFTKQKDTKKVYLINQTISNPNINENNHPDIRKHYIKNTKHNFFKAISSNYLL